MNRTHRARTRPRTAARLPQRLPGLRAAVAAVSLLLVAGLVQLTGVTTAQAATRVMPGSFTGYAFDACQAPSQRAMDVWREHSPYWAVGIYTSGVNRYCADQEHLSPAWVAEQDRKGWRLLPLHVGLQAACRTDVKRWKLMSADPADGYAKARGQGRAAAREAVKAARSYGIAPRSTLWYDLEAFDTSRTRCRESALNLVSAWTRKVRALGYRSGFYSSAASGIRMLEDARLDSTDGYALPDQIWIADWNDRHTTRSGYISDEGWQRARVHQYSGGHDETYGGVTINVDSNFMDVGRGSVAGRSTPRCGVPVDFLTYPELSRGDRGPYVAAAQCMLRRRGSYDGEAHGRFDRPTARAVRRYQDHHPGLSVSGEVTQRTWTALTAAGTTPTSKFGSAGNAVRRLQRALNAADRARLEVSGVFEATTRAAVRDYQLEHRLRGSGVVNDAVWTLLQAGRT